MKFLSHTTLPAGDPVEVQLRESREEDPSVKRRALTTGASV